MSVIHEPGSTRPGRAVGLVLIGLAVIAAVLGVITLIDGDGANPPSGSPPSSQPAATTTESTPGGGGQPTQTGQPPASTSAVPPPVTTTTAVAQPPPPPNPRQVPVRVFNNGTVSGLAAQAARDFRNDGWNVVEVGNYSQGIIPTTTAYFRQGTDEEAAARAMAEKFNMRAEARFPGIANSSSGVIVMITNDYGGK